MPTQFVSLQDLATGGQLALPFHHSRPTPTISITPEIEEMLAGSCAVAIGVSGGKDSQACALRLTQYLNDVGHTGPRVLVHADLGSVEWEDSLPACERLADRLNLELMIVYRKAGGMMTRWRQRWKNNVLRYQELSCVRLIVPWSTPSMRYCTSELKLAPIASALKKRFRTCPIINVSGIRRQESAMRSRMPIAQLESRLTRAHFPGFTWNPILDWSLFEVLAEIRRSGMRLHEAYEVYRSSRVSCAFCIMSSAHDLSAAASCAHNHAVYREMVELEAESTFAFQGARWLADVAPQLLDPDLRARIQQAKEKALERQRIEAEIPDHLLYSKGWPTVMPTFGEAELIASARLRISALIPISCAFLTAETVRARYAALLEAKATRHLTS
jgi:3'-phosphoadenosine 5'-phosphosulfate sulfotransferase (PAPS reductase)/FAD synthetase